MLSGFLSSCCWDSQVELLKAKVSRNAEPLCVIPLEFQCLECPHWDSSKLPVAVGVAKVALLLLPAEFMCRKLGFSVRIGSFLQHWGSDVSCTHFYGSKESC